tara:strand:+ start:4704 stop:6218 length:1515 start_codon:yes stop_codon:yes gene_type:complete
MYQCGPAENLGASVLFLPSTEIDCEFPSRVPDPGKRVYLSYPSGWLWAYLPAYALLRSVLPESVAPYHIVRILGLCLIRLPLLAALILWTRHQLEFFPGLPERPAIVCSFVANAIFASSPAFLHYTQNIVFTDMIVLPIVYASGLLMYRFPRKALWSRLLLLAFLLWISTATAWYGALWSTFLVGLLFFGHKEYGVSRKHAMVLAAGPVLAAIHYCLQLTLLPGGWSQLANTAAQRTGGISDLLAFYGQSISYWSFNLPLPIAWGSLFLGILIAAYFLMVLSSAWNARSRSRQRLLLLYGPLLCSIAHLLILSEHSSRHDFSALKFGPMITYCILAGIISGFRKFGRAPKAMLPVRVHHVAASTALIAVLSTGAVRKSHRSTAGLPEPEIDHVSLAALHQRISENEIPVTLASPRKDGYVPMEATGWNPPQGLALSGREIYTPERLRKYESAFAASHRNAPVALLGFAPHRGYPCEWESTGLLFTEGIALVCRPGWTVRQFLSF